jgi:N6-adenosine-specific RNA methylase IME4
MIEERLTNFDKARAALAKAKTVDELLNIKDSARRLRRYLKQSRESLEMQNQAAAIGVRAERRAGEMLRDGERARAGDNQYTRAGSNTLLLPPTLEEIGIKKIDSSRLQALASIPEEIFEQTITETCESGRELTRASLLRVDRELKREELRERDRERVRTVPSAVLAPGQRVPTIVADFPWDYGDLGYAERSDAVQPDYAQMSLDEIRRVDIPGMAEPNAHLYTWCPNAFLVSGKVLKIIEDDWGFRPIELVTWFKVNRPVVGAYHMVQTEHMIFAVRGSLAMKDILTNAIFAEAPPEHSAKPEEAYQLIEATSRGPWLELYARRPSPRRGWVTWGNITKTAER